MLGLLFPLTFIGMVLAVLWGIGIEDKQRGERFLENIKRLSLSNSTDFWKGNLNEKIQYPDGKIGYTYDTFFGYIRLTKIVPHIWEVSVSYEQDWKAFHTFTYDTKEEKEIESSWRGEYFNGHRGFLSMKKKDIRTVASLQKSLIQQHLQKLDKGESHASEEEKQPTSSVDEAIAYLQNGNYTIQSVGASRYAVGQHVGTNAFIIHSGLVVHWTNNEKTETFKRMKNGEVLYTVTLDKESNAVIKWDMKHDAVKSIEDEQAFAYDEKRLWQAIRKEWKKQQEKRRRIQDMWEEKPNEQEENVWHQKEKEWLDKVLSFAPYYEQLDTADVWYLSEKFPERLQQIRELSASESLSLEQFETVFAQIEERLRVIEERVQSIKQTEGKLLVRLTATD